MMDIQTNPVRIADIRATTVTVPLEAPLRHANGCHWGRFVRTIVEVETDNGIDRPGRNGRRRRIGRSRLPRHEGVSGRPRSRAARRDALPHRQSHRVALQQPHAGAGRARIRLPRHSRPGVGRAGFAKFSAADCATASLSPPIASSAIRIRAPAKAKCAPSIRWSRRTRAMKQPLRLHHPQAEGRRVSSGLRAGGLSRPGGGISRRFAALRSQRRLVHRAGHSLRPGHRRPAQRLSGGSGFRPERHAAHARNGARFRWPPTPWWSTSSSSPPTCSNTAVDVILLDTTFWGGIRACVKAAGVCETFQLGVAVHSSGELGIQLATMLHLGAVIAESLLRRRRALSSPDRRHHRGRPDAVRRRRHSRFPKARPGREARSRKAARVQRALSSGWAAIPTIRIPGAPAGPH